MIIFSNYQKIRQKGELSQKFMLTSNFGNMSFSIVCWVLLKIAPIRKETFGLCETYVSLAKG